MTYLKYIEGVNLVNLITELNTTYFDVDIIKIEKDSINNRWVLTISENN